MVSNQLFGLKCSTTRSSILKVNLALNMPEIIVNISNGSSQVSNKMTEITTNTLGGLLSALKTAKEETNTILTKIVEEASKESKQTRKTTQDDESCSDEESEKELDDESVKKKQKS